MAKVEEIMRLLDCTRDEALDVIAKDKEIDKGAKHFELNADQKQAEKKMRSTGQRAVNAYGRATKVERPQDTEKRALIQAIKDAVCHFSAKADIINPEREIRFQINGKNYKIILSCPRN